MNNLKWIGIVILAVVITACSGAIEYNNMSFDNNQYSLDVPTYMEKQASGNEATSMEYGNEMRAHFAMVIAETKQSLEDVGLDFTIEDYADFAVNFTKDAITDAQVERVHDDIKVINGLESISFKLRGIFEEIGEELFYYITIFKSDDNFYNLTSYTTVGKEAKYTPVIETMINSFKEL